MVLENVDIEINEYLSGELDCERLPYIRGAEDKEVNGITARRRINIVKFGRIW